MSDINQIGGLQDSKSLISVRKASKINMRATLLSALPADKVIAYDSNLIATGGVVDMNVDGNTSPGNFFQLKPAVSEIYVVNWLTLVLVHPGTMLPDSFGSIPGGLANGLEVVYGSDEGEVVTTTCKDNIDLTQCFFGGFVTTKSRNNSDVGLFDTPDYLLGKMEFTQPIFLDGTQGEYLGIRVNDDLTDVDFMRSTIRYNKLLVE